jgi:bloom syndrome protein
MLVLADPSFQDLTANVLKPGKNCSDFLKRRRKVRIQIRTSPNGKGKAVKRPAVKRGTGVAASRQDFPQSTNVSSPVQASSRRRIAQYKRTTEPEVQAHGYLEDDSAPEFSAYDGNNIDGTEDDSDDELGHIREAGRPQRSKKKQLGPPITMDEKLDKLNKTHKLVVEDFMVHAGAESRTVSL